MRGAQSLARNDHGASRPALDVAKVRADFPILQVKAHGKPLVYLDNAATSQNPRQVIEAESAYYETSNSNIHRGIHYLSERATAAYEKSRDKVRDFLNARDRAEIVFVRGTTEGINLVAHSFVRPRLREGDEILISAMEHHSNIVPWQLACEATGAVLKVAPINDAGEILLDEFEKLIGPRTKLVSVVHVSNALGTVNPVKRMIAMAHDRGVPVLLDGAQAAPHSVIDVQDLGCDFYAFSGHKAYAPTGIGALYGKIEHLRKMSPYQGGGDMISSVTFEKTTYNEIPHKFEAGTPNVAGTIGLGAAIDYMNSLGREAIAAHEAELLAYATQKLSEVPGARIIGTAREKVGVVSFLVGDIHPHDIGTVLDLQGVAIRAGHHCTQPLMHRFNVNATARASFGCYNTKEEVDTLVAGLHKVIEVFS